MSLVHSGVSAYDLLPWTRIVVTAERQGLTMLGGLSAADLNMLDLGAVLMDESDRFHTGEQVQVVAVHPGRHRVTIQPRYGTSSGYAKGPRWVVITSPTYDMAHVSRDRCRFCRKKYAATDTRECSTCGAPR